MATRRPSVILCSLEHFISGHDSLAESEAEATRLNQEARAHGRPPYYLATPRRRMEDLGRQGAKMRHDSLRQTGSVHCLSTRRT
jgi:hypothetical protein